jgi:hypothetical protein
VSAAGGELRLQLAHPLVADNGSLFAEDFVAQGFGQGIAFDYSAGSIGYLDSIIVSLREQKVTADRVADVLFGFGAYLGEAVLRSTGGAWVATGPTTGRSSFPIVVRLASGVSCNPLDRPFTALADGERASLSAFYAEYVRL